VPLSGATLTVRRLRADTLTEQRLRADRLPVTVGTIGDLSPSTGGELSPSTADERW
jgi:hypothetical protein